MFITRNLNRRSLLWKPGLFFNLFSVMVVTVDVLSPTRIVLGIILLTLSMAGRPTFASHATEKCQVIERLAENETALRFQHAGLKYYRITNINDLNLTNFDKDSVIVVALSPLLSSSKLDELQTTLEKKPTKEVAMNFRGRTDPDKIKPTELTSDVFSAFWSIIAHVRNRTASTTGRGYFTFRATSDRNGGRIQEPHEHLSDEVNIFLSLRGEGVVILDAAGNPIYQARENELVLFGGYVIHGSPPSVQTRLIAIASVDNGRGL